MKRFPEYLAYELSRRPDSWRGFLYINVILFHFWTFCIDWFAFLFWLRHSENTEWVAVILTDVAFEDCDFLGDVFSFELFDKDPDLTQFICV